MLTKFGKVLRKLRIERSEILKNMADYLRVSSAYLSAVETGARAIPGDWIAKLTEIYSLNQTEANELFDAAAETRNAVSLNFEGVQNERKRTAVLFAREFENIDEEKLRRIKEILTQS